MTLAANMRTSRLPPINRSLRSEAAIPRGIRAPPVGEGIRENPRGPRRDWRTRHAPGGRLDPRAAREEQVLGRARPEPAPPQGGGIPVGSYWGLWARRLRPRSAP